MTEANDLTRVHVRVQGRVQGVGFRAYVEHQAHKLEVAGWVRNVGYDVVELVAEGTRAKLDRLADLTKAGPQGARVDEATVEWEKATGEFNEFAVRRSI